MAELPGPRRRVVVTGLGAVTPIGDTAASTWSAMLSGTSGPRALAEPWAARLPVRIAAPADVDAAAELGRARARRMDRCEQLALIAAREAYADAGAPPVDPFRLGVSVGSAVGGISSVIAAADAMRDRGWSRISPYSVPMLMPNGSAGWISMDLGARAGAHALLGASGAESIGYGIGMIRAGRADIVLAGGAEASITGLFLAALAARRDLSPRNHEPERASRPFDAGRDGFVLAEGAGIVVLEAEEHAAARQARVYAEAAGAGYASDARRPSCGDPGSTVQAIAQAIADAGADPAQVAHVSAHAASTPDGDRTEALALAAAFPHWPVVTAVKSLTGHMLGAASAVEAVATVQALVARTAPPTRNLDRPDVTAAELDIATEPRPLAPPAGGPLMALTNAAGYEGHHAALLFSEYRGRG